MKGSKLSLWLARLGVKSSESLLRPTSPVRAWLARRRENSEAGSSAALLGALTDPAANWVDHAVGYAALREIDLSPTERTHANHLLSQALLRPPLGRTLMTHLGPAVVLAGAISTVTAVALAVNGSDTALGTAATVLTVLSPLFCLGRMAWNRRRTNAVWREAATTLAQIGDRECLLALSDHPDRRAAIHSEALAALHAILPTVAAPTDAPLSPEIAQALTKLAHSPTEDLALATLDALERAGSGEDVLRAVTRLTQKAKSQRVRARAAVALPILTARQKLQLSTPAMSRSMAALRREKPIRAWLKSYPEGSNAALLSALSDPRDSPGRDRARAFQAIIPLDLSPAERAQANHLLAQALKATGTGGALTRNLFHAAAAGFLTGSLVAGAIVSALLLYLLGGEPWPQTIPEILQTGSLTIAAFTILTSPLVFVGTFVLDNLEAVGVQRTAALAAAHIGGPECIPPLHDHLSENTAISGEAALALLKILPLVTEEWYGHLPAGVGQILARLTQSPRYPLALEALEAVGRAGGGETVEAVTRLTRNFASDTLQQRAIEILPTLLLRRDQEISSASLLRPSQANAPEHLLHPIYGPDPDTTNLLRASHANGPASDSPPGK